MCFFSLMNKKLKDLVIYSIILVVYLIWGHFTHLYIPCLVYEITGLYCPGCGATRMIISMLHFDFKQAFFYNQLLFVSTPIFIVLFIDYVISNIRGKKELYKKIPNIVYYIYIALLIIFMIIRNIFPYFAPTNI